MCGCTHADPAQCECGVNGPCRCSCHRHYVPMAPRNPLAERDAEIERLQARIALLEDAARTYLVNSTPVNAVRLSDVLKEREQDAG